MNESFFPAVSRFTRDFVSIFLFASTYFLSPIGAIFFGYIGDTFGRKATIIISSLLMSGCCITVAFLPTYEHIGITATIVLTLCRMIQGMSGATELTGSEIYLSESLKPPIQYPIVALLVCFAKLGNFSALCLAYFCTSTAIVKYWSDSWRIAFLIGSVIGVVGAVARNSLKEASEFSDKQRLLKEVFKRANIEWSKKNPSINPKIPFETCLAYFFVCCAKPLCFYLILFHCGEILKDEFEYTPAQIIRNNLLPTMFNILTSLFVAYYSYKIRPLVIIKFKLVIFSISLIAFLFAFTKWHDPKTLVLFQCIWAIFRFDNSPATPIFLKYFHALKRFRYTSIIRSTSITFSYTAISFLLVCTTKQFGHAGILLVFIPLIISFALSLRYFEQKEEEEKRQSIARQKSTFA